MLILVPADVLRPRMVDEHFRAEAEAALLATLMAQEGTVEDGSAGAP